MKEPVYPKATTVVVAPDGDDAIKFDISYSKEAQLGATIATAQSVIDTLKYSDEDGRIVLRLSANARSLLRNAVAHYYRALLTQVAEGKWPG